MLAYISWHPEMVKRNGKLPVVPFVVGRYVRTIPMVIGALLIFFAFPMSWGDGPVWQYAYNNVTGNCLNGWIHELLYMSNQREATTIVRSWV